MIDGVWTKVLDVVVPSWNRGQCHIAASQNASTYVLDLLHGKVGVRGHARLLWLDIDDDQQGVWRVALEQFVDLEIRRPQLGPRVVPPY